LPLTPPKNEYKPLDSCRGEIKILDESSTSQIHLWSKSKICGVNLKSKILRLSAHTEVSNLKSTDFHRSAIAFDSQIPLFYPLAMGINAITALIFERQVRSHRHLGPDVCSPLLFTICPIGMLRKSAGGIARNDFIGYRYGSRGIYFESSRSWTRACRQKRFRLWHI
jgi:hypothetical protein